MTASRVKAVDVKAFSHIFPLYFLPLAEELKANHPLTAFQFLVKNMIELNAYVIVWWLPMFHCLLLIMMEEMK